MPENVFVYVSLVTGYKRDWDTNKLNFEFMLGFAIVFCA